MYRQNVLSRHRRRVYVKRYLNLLGTFRKTLAIQSSVAKSLADVTSNAAYASDPLYVHYSFDDLFDMPRVGCTQTSTLSCFSHAIAMQPHHEYMDELCRKIACIREVCKQYAPRRFYVRKRCYKGGYRDRFYRA